MENPMPPTTAARRPSAAARRVGYFAGIVIGAALLFVLNAQPGWQALPFLTSNTSQVIGLVNLSLAVSLAVNMVYLCYDPPWLKSLGDLVTSAIGLAAAIRVWQVFPFAFHGSSAWSAAVRVLLILVIGGSAINIVVQAVSLTRRSTHHTPHGGRLSTRTRRTPAGACARSWPALAV
jgi:hypothetical protein